MNEFILTMILAMFGDVEPPLSVGVADLNNGRNAETRINMTEGSYQIVINRDRLSATDPVMHGHKYSKVENTIVHELCHVKVHMDGRDDPSTDGHNRPWRRCMDRHGAWYRHSRSLVSR